MANETDEYDVFLENWCPSELFQHATLPQNLGDPYLKQRLFEDSTGQAKVERAGFKPGKKVMSVDELTSRGLEFFQDNQERWAEEFRDYVLHKDIPPKKIDTYVSGFANLWIDGRSRRQDSSEMLAIKASIQRFDQFYYPTEIKEYVINSVDGSIPPLFSIEEMAIIFEANSGLIDAFLPDYIDYLDEDGLNVVSDLTIRRGVNMPSSATFRRELHYLSSYSLALGPVEQFAQLWAGANKRTEVPSIFSAPLPAIQNRIVAFAPFIKGMDLSQLEFVVAPPIENTTLVNQGSFGGISEFRFE